MTATLIKGSTMWWESKDFINALNKEFADWKKGKEKGYTLEEIDSLIAQLKTGKQP